MTNKQIETSREIRLWIGQVIVPAAMLVMVPEVREGLKTAVAKAKVKIKAAMNA